MLSVDEKDPACLCSTLRLGDRGVPAAPGVVEGSVSPVCAEVDALLRLRLTVVKKPLPLRLISCMELAGELSAGLELSWESSAIAWRDCAELCRFRLRRSMVVFFPSSGRRR